MIRPVGLAVAVWSALAPVAGAGSAERADGAAEALLRAVADLEQAQTGRDQVQALSRAIQAYEAGLDGLREALRQASLREASLALRLDANRDRLSRLLGVLSGISAEAGPAMLLHPDGALGTARSGMLLGEVTPALRAEVDRLRAELEELHRLRQVQRSAEQVLLRGLSAAQDARSALSQAIAARGPLPRRFTDDPERLRLLIEDADTLDALATGLAPDLNIDGTLRDFASARGRLPLPVLGTVLRHADEPDAAGIVRPGMVLATRPGALVTAPWPATIRYRGPFLDYGNVMILEPGPGYLLILSGLGTVFGDVGEIVAAGAPLGLMGGAAGPDGQGAERTVDAGAIGSETLYMEIRQGGQPVDPADWFAAAQEQDRRP
ncbi:MAG: murein hydrolase activator EnvC family protein [Gemmobacter sp.]